MIFSRTAKKVALFLFAQLFLCMALYVGPYSWFFMITKQQVVRSGGPEALRCEAGKNVYKPVISPETAEMFTAFLTLYAVLSCALFVLARKAGEQQEKRWAAASGTSQSHESGFRSRPLFYIHILIAILFFVLVFLLFTYPVTAHHYEIGTTLLNALLFSSFMAGYFGMMGDIASISAEPPAHTTG